MTNTNWQAYSGESALSYFSQAIGLTVQNFVTPAVGMAVLFALFRGLVSEGGPGLGNFFVDATRAVLFVLIPLALVVTVVDVWQGSPQNVSEYQEVQLLEPVGIDSEGEVVEADDPAAVQVIDEGVVPMGPQASQVAIKQLGTNGGGYNGVNSASALENPTPLTNLVQCISLLLIPFALVFSFGRFVADRRQGRAIFAAMFVVLVASLAAVSYTHLWESDGFASRRSGVRSPYAPPYHPTAARPFLFSSIEQQQVHYAQHGNMGRVVGVEEPFHGKPAAAAISVEQRDGCGAAYERVEDEGEQRPVSAPGNGARELSEQGKAVGDGNQ